MPNFNAVVRMLIGGVPTQPFSMADLPMLGHSNPQLLSALKQLSAAKFGRPKAQVDAEIFARLKTDEVPKPSFGTTPGSSPFGAPKAAAGGSSFLDDWLAKRKASNAAGPSTMMPTATKPSVPTPPTHQVAQAPVAVVKQTAFTPTSIDINTAGKDVSYVDAQRNISSSSLDAAEASTIADKIKQQLKTTDSAIATQDVVPEKKLEPVQNKPTNGEFQHDDTIYIDKEGNFSAAPTDSSQP
jgi:hypothetical protein